VLGTSRYEGVKLERGEDKFETVLNVHTYLSTNLTPIFYLPLLNSVVNKKLSLHINNFEGHLPPPHMLHLCQIDVNFLQLNS
jgi:hypothetical protein